MLIDASYFTKGSRHILNASLGKMPDPNAIEVTGAIHAYIGEYQEKYLAEMLGRTIGRRINAYLDCLESDEDPHHFENLDKVCDELRDSFADYVFWHILRDMNTQSTMTGLVRLKCANEYVAPINRQVSVWNTMVDKHRRFEQWSNSEDCPLRDICIENKMLTKINNLNL